MHTRALPHHPGGVDHRDPGLLGARSQPDPRPGAAVGRSTDCGLRFSGYAHAPRELRRPSRCPVGGMSATASPPTRRRGSGSGRAGKCPLRRVGKRPTCAGKTPTVCRVSGNASSRMSQKIADSSHFARSRRLGCDPPWTGAWVDLRSRVLRPTRRTTILLSTSHDTRDRAAGAQLPRRVRIHYRRRHP